MITTGSAAIDVGQPHVIHLTGDIDMETAPVLLDAVHRVLAAGPDAPDVVVDMAELTFMDSVGLSTMVMASHDVAALGKRLTLRNVPERTERLLEMTKLDEVFPIERPQASLS